MHVIEQKGRVCGVFVDDINDYIEYLEITGRGRWKEVDGRVLFFLSVRDNEMIKINEEYLKCLQVANGLKDMI